MRRALLTVLLVPTIVIGVASCVLPTTRPPQPTAAPTTPIVTQPDAPPPTPGSAIPDVAKLQTVVTQVEQQTGAKIGIATSTKAAGSISTGPAWSTAKVPVAIAALRKNSAITQSNMWAAITASDNQAAASLWESLGPPTTAADATDQVLRDGGDATTHTQSQVLRPGFSAFGQTQWRLIDQAGFAEHLGTIAGGTDVLAAMSNIAADQRYGLGTIPGAVFKGGWGPEPDSGYVVRQFGLIPGPKPYGIAVMVVTDNYQSGQYALSLAAKYLQA